MKILPYIFCCLILNVANAQSFVRINQYDKKSKTRPGLFKYVTIPLDPSGMPMVEFNNGKLKIF